MITFHKTFLITVVSVFFSVYLLTPTPSNACTTNMSLGSAGTAVTCLQSFLKMTGDYTYPEITGYFGPVTQTAVQAFQIRRSIAQSGTPATTGFGSAGPVTRLTLVKDVIALLQKQLAALRGDHVNTGGNTSTPPSSKTDTKPKAGQCVFNGQSIKNGASVVAFREASVPHGGTCTSQPRNCMEGSLSGSYEYSSCSVEPEPPVEYEYSIGNFVGGDEPTLYRPLTPSGGKTYNYDPSVIKDGNMYKMYWCGGIAGDFILHAESNSLEGPWHASNSTVSNSFDIALKPSTDKTKFDSVHACNPTIAKFNNQYFLYWTGLDIGTTQGLTDGSHYGQIGGALSNNSINWLRASGGDPIVTPARKKVTNSPYGTGMQTVTYAKGKYYMLMYDSTGADSYSTGAGIYVIRSNGPFFQTGLETWTEDGFVPLTDETVTSAVLYNGVNGDVGYIKDWDMFLFVNHRTKDKVHVALFDGNFNPILGDDGKQLDLLITDTNWGDGPGLVTNPDRSLDVSSTDPNKLHIDIMRAVGEFKQPYTWNLGWRGATITRTAK